MKFKYNGTEYLIEFERQYRQIRSGYDEQKQEQIFKQSRYPYTTAKILTLPDKKVFREATVGAHYKEAFTLEKGRLNAMRLISRTLDKGFKKAFWEAYVSRNNG